jgi:hypothetical protein
MAQFTIAYVALGFAVLLVLGGAFAMSQRPTTGLTPLQRIIVWGGLSGMCAFLVAAALWLRR